MIDTERLLDKIEDDRKILDKLKNNENYNCLVVSIFFGSGEDRKSFVFYSKAGEPDLYRFAFVLDNRGNDVKGSEELDGLELNLDELIEFAKEGSFYLTNYGLTSYFNGED